MYRVFTLIIFLKFVWERQVSKPFRPQWNKWHIKYQRVMEVWSKRFRDYSSGVDTGKKMKTSSKFYGFPILANVSPIFHNVSPIFKFFKVRKCERCGSLNPRLFIALQIYWIIISGVLIFREKLMFFSFQSHKPTN